MNETNSITSTNVVGNVVDSIKDSGISGLLDYFTTLDSVNYITFVINLLIFIFGRQIINNLSVETVGANQSRLRLLRLINTILFLTYLLAVAFQLQLATNFSHTGLLMLLTYLARSSPTRLFSRNTDASGKSRARRCSLNLHLTQPAPARPAPARRGRRLIFSISGISELASNHQLSRGDPVLVFTTKDYWLKDFISGIMVISNGNIERGDVVRIPSENILAIVLETRGTLTILRDLIRNHNITVPNSLLLNVGSRFSIPSRARSLRLRRF